MTHGLNPLLRRCEIGNLPSELFYSHIRYATFQWWKKDIENKEGSMEQFALGYENFGFHRVEGGLRYRDWVPGALAVHLYGEFSMKLEKRPTD